MFTTSTHKKLQFFSKSARGLCKPLAISIVILYVIYILSNYSCCNSSALLFTSLTRQSGGGGDRNSSPINISHLVFGIASSSNTWRNRRFSVEAWWQPNAMRGFLFLERARREFFPWPPSSPPLRISEDTSRYREFDKHRAKEAVRMVRMVLETFRAENDSVRWYVMMDDDTVVFVDNLVDVLAKYDHRKYFYVGANSESVSANFLHSFEMGFGGGGYALSYPLAKALAKNMDLCIGRYPTLYGSDHVVQSCVADLGVSLTQEKGFHQIDLHRDISGFLSAHPQSPLVSLHHLDAVDPIFPSMDRLQSLNHLMRAARADTSRLLQQTICYSEPHNWTLSLSWGYSAQIYPGIHHPSILQTPLETFLPWSRAARPPYMFNTRFLSKNPCEAPHVFFFDSVEESDENRHIVTSYSRTSLRNFRACSSSGNSSTRHIYQIRVLSSMTKYHQGGNGRECCDVVQEAGLNATQVKLRTCLKAEILA